MKVGYIQCVLNKNGLQMLKMATDSDIQRIYRDKKNCIPDKELHCTLMCDESESVEQKNPSRKTMFGVVSGVALMGDAVVLLLKSSDLHDRFKELISMGFKHDYDDYTPHMSLCYDRTKEQENEIKKLNKLKGLLLSFEETEWRQTKEV